MQLPETGLAGVVSDDGELLEDDGLQSLLLCAARLALEPTPLQLADVVVTLGVAASGEGRVRCGVNGVTREGLHKDANLAQV